MRMCLSFALMVLGVCFMLGSPSLAGKGNKPPPPPPDPAIAYVSWSSSGAGLWVMNLDGSNKTSIFGAPSVHGPSFSPDGLELACLSDAQGSGVYVVGVGGGSSRKIAAKSSPYLGGGSDWSPHGWIAFADAESGGSSPEDIFVVRPDGSGLMNLTNTPGRAEFSPTWNAAGDMLAVKAYNIVGTLPTDPVIVYSVALVDGVPTVTGETNVTNVAGSPFENGVNVANPNFARNSDRLVVQAALPGESSRNLWILDLADPANPQRLTSTEDRILPAWCDGDSRIVFNANFRGGSVLWSIDAASGADLRRLGDRDQRDAACRR